MQHIPKMKHIRNTDQVGQLKTTSRIGFAQRRHISAGDAFAIFGDKTFGEPRPQLVAAP